MGLFDELKSTAGQVFKKVGETVGELKDRAGLEYQIYQVNQEIQQAKDEMNRVHQAMGQRVYDLHKQGQITDPQLTSTCQEVEILAQKMEQLTTKVNQLRDDFAKQQAAAKMAEPQGTESKPPDAK
ncbi:MAG: hypothetical protein HY815_02890 [Candidatus Riflebacteria bacterium]|nr:hypothetical protein [Candidatus Riflebacteria bacterium]